MIRKTQCPGRAEPLAQWFNISVSLCTCMVRLLQLSAPQIRFHQHVREGQGGLGSSSVTSTADPLARCHRAVLNDGNVFVRVCDSVMA